MTASYTPRSFLRKFSPSCNVVTVSTLERYSRLTRADRSYAQKRAERAADLARRRSWRVRGTRKAQLEALFCRLMTLADALNLSLN